MSDESTSRIPDVNNNASTTQEQVRRLSQAAQDIVDLLRNQREILQQRGMNLPSGSLDSLRTLKMRLDAFGRQQAGMSSELRQLRALAGTTALINSTLETDVVLNRVMDTVIQLTGAERGYIVLKDRETGQLDQFRVARGLDREQLEGDAEGRFIVSKTIVNDVAATGEPVLTDNASKDTRYQDQKSVVGYSLRSILAVPLKVRGEVIGVVYCDNRIQSGLFQKHELDLLNAFSNQAGVAVENARLFDTARAQLAQTTEMRDFLDNVFDSITSGILTVDNGGTILRANSAARSILSNDELVGHNFEDVLPPMDDAFFAAINTVLESGQQKTLVSEPVVGGDPRHWNVIISALRDPDGNRQGLTVVIDDLTEQYQRERTLTEVRRYLPLALVENIRRVADVKVVGEERIITSITCDVRGFTTFSEHLPPERLMEIINKYLSVASDAINLYEGIVDKYMGDAVTGLFNTQLNPQEDHAIRAVRAAMSVIYDLYALHEVLPEEQRLFYGIGIHTGPAFLGNVGGTERREFTAIGDATTISKILESNAHAGEIIISAATHALVEEYFECEARAPEKTKGRSDIEVVYRVLRRKKGIATANLFIDPELAELLNESDGDEL